MDEETTETLAELYGLITSVYRAKDIKTAEAAKVIENNELAIIFHKMGLDTKAPVRSLIVNNIWKGSIHW